MVAIISLSSTMFIVSKFRQAFNIWKANFLRIDEEDLIDKDIVQIFF